MRKQGLRKIETLYFLFVLTPLREKVSIEQLYQVSLDTAINPEEYDFAKFGNKFVSWELHYICKAMAKENFLDYIMMIFLKVWPYWSPRRWGGLRRRSCRTAWLGSHRSSLNTLVRWENTWFGLDRRRRVQRWAHSSPRYQRPWVTLLGMSFCLS